MGFPGASRYHPPHLPSQNVLQQMFFCDKIFSFKTPFPIMEKSSCHLGPPHLSELWMQCLPLYMHQTIYLRGPLGLLHSCSIKQHLLIRFTLTKKINRKIITPLQLSNLHQISVEGPLTKPLKYMISTVECLILTIERETLINACTDFPGI